MSFLSHTIIFIWMIMHQPRFSWVIPFPKIIRGIVTSSRGNDFWIRLGGQTLVMIG